MEITNNLHLFESIKVRNARFGSVLLIKGLPYLVCDDRGLIALNVPDAVVLCVDIANGSAHLIPGDTLGREVNGHVTLRHKDSGIPPMFTCECGEQFPANLAFAHVCKGKAK